jgi:hypothetical protein
MRLGVQEAGKNATPERWRTRQEHRRFQSGRFSAALAGSIRTETPCVGYQSLSFVVLSAALCNTKRAVIAAARFAPRLQAAIRVVRSRSRAAGHKPPEIYRWFNRCNSSVIFGGNGCCNSSRYIPCNSRPRQIRIARAIRSSTSSAFIAHCLTEFLAELDRWHGDRL